MTRDAIRIEPDFRLEKDLRKRGFPVVAGVDEAGRGCLAGPVVAAAVVFPPNLSLEGLNDSKELSPEERTRMFAVIRNNAVSVGIGSCSPDEIDRLNILWAAMEAMRRAVDKLDLAADYLLVDGNTCFPACPVPYRTVIGGDKICASIAAASIIAKVTRDRMMQDLHLIYPHYGWHTHKGYATREHYEALDIHGPCEYHRRTFRLNRDV